MLVDNAVITLDVDWAPDFIITHVANLLIDQKIKATWFVTHNSPAIQDLFNFPELFEIGIHPNFMRNTTQGTSDEDVMKFLMKIVPDATSVRTHGLFQSSSLMKMMTVKFGMKNDVSIYLREVPHIIPFEVYYGKKSLLRMPYYWTEDGEMYKPKPSFLLNPRKMKLPGLKIFGFHPIHIYLNSENMKNYNLLKQSVDLKDCSERDVERHIHKGIGAKTLFHDIIQDILQSERSFTISDIAAEWESVRNKMDEYERYPD